MARLSVKYDEELKEQVFFLRGDENYARTTKTLLELPQPTMDSLSFSLDGVKVNVLRDKGTGTIHIYDNDSIIYTIDNWNAQMNGVTFNLTDLAYGVDHNIVAKYMGNNQCSPSNSKTEYLNIENPNYFASTLSLSNGATQFNPNAEYTNTVTLSNEGASSFNNGQAIEIWYDNTLIDTVSTGNNGNAEFRIPDMGSVGSHTLSVMFRGGDNLYASSITKTISVGYILTPTSYPNPVVAYTDGGYNYSVKLTDGLGNPISNKTVYLQSVPPSQTPADIGSGTTNSSGMVTINDIVSIFRFKTIINGVTYYSETITVPWVSLNSLTITPSEPLLYKNEENTISFLVDSNVEGIPITLTGDVTGTVYTNANGVATKTIKGEGFGSKTINAIVGGLYESIELLNYITYWSKYPNDSSTVHGDVGLLAGKMLDLINNYRFDYDANLAPHIRLPFESNYSWKYVVEGIQGTIMISYFCTDISNPSDIVDVTPFRTFTDGKIEVEFNRDTGIQFNITDGSYTFSRTMPGISNPRFEFALLNQNNSGTVCTVKRISYRKW